MTKSLELKHAEHFNYIKRGANVQVAHRPATSLNNTLDALRAIGINDVERDELFKVSIHTPSYYLHPVSSMYLYHVYINYIY